MPEKAHRPRFITRSDGLVLSVTLIILVAVADLRTKLTAQVYLKPLAVQGVSSC